MADCGEVCIWWGLVSWSCLFVDAVDWVCCVHDLAAVTWSVFGVGCEIRGCWGAEGGILIPWVASSSETACLFAEAVWWLYGVRDLAAFM